MHLGCWPVGVAGTHAWIQKLLILRNIYLLYCGIYWPHMYIKVPQQTLWNIFGIIRKNLSAEFFLYCNNYQNQPTILVGLEYRVMCQIQWNCAFQLMMYNENFVYKLNVITWYYLYLISKNYAIDATLNKYNDFDIFSRSFLIRLMNLVNSR